MQLEIVIKYPHQCDKHHLWPNREWSVEDLWIILQMTGLSGSLPRNIDYNGMVNTMLNHIVFQTPPIYCILLDGYVLYQPHGLHIENDELVLNSLTRKSLYPYNGCEAAWNDFLKYFNANPRYVIPEVSTNLLRKKEEEILFLTEEIKALQAQIKPTEYTRKMLSQKDDRLRTLQDQLSLKQITIEENIIRTKQLESDLHLCRQQNLEKIEELQKIKEELQILRSTT